MDIVLLREFLIDVPTCVETDSLMRVWQIFQQAGCSYVVILNEQQTPLGILSLARLIAPLFTQPTAQASDTTIAPQADRAQQSIQLLIAAVGEQTILDPVSCLPSHWTLDQLSIDWINHSATHWVLVNSRGQYVGSIDRLQLLQTIAISSLTVKIPDQTSNPVSEPVLSNSVLSNPVLSEADPQDPGQQDLDQNAGQDADQKTVQEASATQPGKSDASGGLLDPLIDLLERLPIPLMLQTTTGRVITQNWVWRQQIGELQDPVQVQQEAASILETETSTEHFTSVRSRSVAESSFVANTVPNFDTVQVYANSREQNHTPLQSTQANGICRLGAEPNVCICTCPMKSGQDRIWQFVKVPMGTAPNEDFSHFYGATEVAEAAPAFKLAALSFHPDPTWRSLIQTEILWLVLAQDVTEQHQVAKELAAKNADLVQLNRLKDEFLACISHELKTPLTAVLGLSSLLKNRLLGELNERQSRYAQLIHQSGRHLILIVNDILDLARIETGQLELTLEPVQIRTVCAQAYEQACQFQAMEASDNTQGKPAEVDVQFNLSIQAGLHNLVADELRLRQMLTNLFSNAIKFTEAGGNIGLRVEDWEGWIAFTVWDTGIGIPAEKQHLIFQKFQQLENPLTRRFDGTGLGLVLTQRLARLHGGDVTFTSVEGKGSEFTLLLPPCPPQALTQDLETRTGEAFDPLATPSLLPRSAQNSSNITSANHLVLVVEAAPQAIDNLTHHLTGLGYRVAIARSGTEALEKVRRLQPCVIFLSPLLPLLSGWDVLTLLKADSTTREIPVVVTAMRVEKNLAYQNGADGFLSLPIHTVALEQCLDQLISRQDSQVHDPLSNVTVLHLRGQFASVTASTDADSLPNLNRLLHPYRCRVLEVDDLEQADLLARVWKPNLVLIDGMFDDALAFMTELSQSPFLATLPIVTLTTEITQAANQVPGLTIFPCFAMQRSNSPQIHSSAASQSAVTQSTVTQSTAAQSAASQSAATESPRPELSTLIQVLQMVVGIHWKPHILIADFSTLAENWMPSTLASATPKTHHSGGDPAKTSGVQALEQYIHTAGFRNSIGTSWQEILHQLQHRGVDLLLFYVHSSQPHPLFAQMEQDLQQLEVKPPILVWHCNAYSKELILSTADEFVALWQRVATQVLPPCLSMPDLLTEINQALQRD